MMLPTISSSTGMLTNSSHDSPTSSRIAMMIPPIAQIGADTSIVRLICTSICTCWTSFVIRVMSDGAPNVPTSRAENPVTRSNRSRRTSRPYAMATRDPMYTATMVSTT